MKSAIAHSKFGTMMHSGLSAWVVFTGETDLPWLCFLKPGFRHCFVLMHDGKHWISVDPLANHTEVTVHHVPSDFNLPEWLAKRGQKVVRAQVCRTRMRVAPVGLFTCVEAVKRVLGLHDGLILTPWQLYRRLVA
jgi:hypothetical protein